MTTATHPARGTHALIDGNGADPLVLDDAVELTRRLRAAVTAIGATVLRAVSHTFAPQGASVVLVLAESHATVHTYPEAGVYFADIFTCGDLDAEKAANCFAASLGGTAQVQMVTRSA